MSAPLLRYVVVSSDLENLRKEVENVAENVDAFEISDTLCQNLIHEFEEEKDVYVLYLIISLFW